MKKIMLASVALVAFASPSFAQGFSFGGGTNFNNVLTNAGDDLGGKRSGGFAGSGSADLDWFGLCYHDARWVFDRRSWCVSGPGSVGVWGRFDR